MNQYKTLFSLFLAALLLLPGYAVSAGTWVKSVEECGECSVKRGSDTLQALPLMPLQQGDKVTVSGEAAKLVLVDSKNKLIELKPGKSAYSVKEKSADNKLPAPAGDALEWFRLAAGSLLPGASMITRGTENPPQINGMDSDANRVSTSVGKLVFVWDFGQPPFTTAIFDGSEKLVQEKTTDKQKLAVSLKSLRPGTYRFVLKSTFDGEAVSDEYPFSVVDDNSLPGELAAIGTSKMPETIRKMFKGIILAQYPEWRFMALQLAINVKDRPLARALLEEESH